MDKSFYILEIDKIFDLFRANLKTKIGKNLLDNIKIFTDANKLNEEYKRFLELHDLILKYQELPFNSHLIMEEEINNAKKGTFFDEITLNDIKLELQSTHELINYFKKIDTNNLLLKEYISNLKYINHLYDLISKTITEDNKVSDNASPTLKSLRIKKEKIDKDIKNRLFDLMEKYQNIMTASNFVLKESKFALPINTSSKNSIDGIILDYSDSGQTTFIEPTIIVNLENEKKLTEYLEKEQVNKILKDITTKILKYSDDLIKNNKIIGYFDLLSAKNTFYNEYNCSIPLITEEQNICLYGARHPLLNKETVVKNDFILTREEPVMLITGPNAGGKTVALKTIATLSYMAKFALPLTIDENSSLSIFRKIYIDIGDNQSIESNLSTFSSHISNLSVIFKYITSKDLVILDELANGTDPKEGDVLSIAIIKFLLQKQCFSIISSHYPLTKKYALNNSKIKNSSFIFNEQLIEPTFKMISGVSGKSYGFLIAHKFGLNKEIINDAKNIYNKNYHNKEEIKLELLEKKEIELVSKENELEERLKEIENRENLLSKKEEEIKAKEEKLKNKKIDDFDDVIDEKIDLLNEYYDEFIQNKISKKEAERKMEELSFLNSTEEIRIGDYCENKSLGISGIVSNIQGEKVYLTSDDGLSFNINKSKLRRIEPPKKQISKKNTVDKDIFNQKQVDFSLNIIGLRKDEAMEKLNNYLSDCVIKKYKSVDIIHGFGTGILKKAVSEELKKSVLVSSFEVDGAITHVKLK